MTTYEQVTGTGPEQLARMQELASRAWSWSSRWHPGELAWFWWEHGGPPPQWRVSTWRAGAHTVAWAWTKAPGRLDLQVDPSHLSLLPQILAWSRRSAGDRPPVIIALDGEGALIDALAGHGYAMDLDGPFFAHLHRDLTRPLAPTSLPAGFTLRALRDERDAETRTAIHRAAFANHGGEEHEPTAATYRRLMADDQYRADLDRIVEDADGTPAAFCLSWLDEPNAVAVLEPVGTDPRYRRRGLARAAILASLRAAVGLGARHARVCARGDTGSVAAKATYESLGFRRYARNVRLIAPKDRASAP